MNLFFVKWKRAVCLSMVTVLVLLGMKAAYYNFGQNTGTLCSVAGGGTIYSASLALREEERKLYFCYLGITCSTDSIMLSGDIHAKIKPAGAEIYRAEIKSNGKIGNLKRIGRCKDFIKQANDPDPNNWTFNYEDNTVKTGKSYVYRYKVYCESAEEMCQYQECYSKLKKGMAAKTVGKYTCAVVKNTAEKLVVKLTGTSKKNGLLEAQYPPIIIPSRTGAELRYKNDGGKEIHRNLDLIKYSYDGKKWHTEGKFSIQGKQSIYLYFKEHDNNVDQPSNNIKFSDYQYAQMFYFAVKYNHQCQLYDRYGSPQIRFNLTSGTAAVSNFTSWEYGEVAFVWDEDIFTRDYENL